MQSLKIRGVGRLYIERDGEAYLIRPNGLVVRHKAKIISLAARSSDFLRAANTLGVPLALPLKYAIKRGKGLDLYPKHP